MKKLILCFCMIFALSGCSLLTTTTKREPTDVEYVNIYEVQSAVTDVISKVESSCIGVYNKISDKEAGTGSGVIFKVDEEKDLFGNRTYYAITNYHVIEDHSSLKVYLGKNTFGDIFINANYVGGSEKEDIAVVSFSSSMELGVTTFGLDDNIIRGQFVIAIGSPLQFSLFNTATLGIVSNVVDGEIQHDSAINPGNSGGGLFNLDGRLVGINTTKYTSTGDISVEGIGFAISIDMVDKICKQIMDGKTDPSGPVMGMTVMEYNTFMAYQPADELSQVKAGLDGGLVVTDITSNLSAHLAGIKKYDVVVKIGNVNTYISTEFKTELDKLKIGDTISITLYRGEELKTIDVLLK